MKITQNNANNFDPSKLFETKRLTVADMVTVGQASDNLFDYVDEETKQKYIEEEGFVYLCIADATSDLQALTGFESFVGRNAIELILTMQPLGHLLDEVMTFYYPETGMSPKDQARFVYAITIHPEFEHIKEVRIITRSAWFVSDCRGDCCRVISPDLAEHTVEGSIYEEIETVEFSKDERVKAHRKGKPALGNIDHLNLIYLLHAKKREFIIYLGEDKNFVYYTRLHELDKKYRAFHYNIWYECNGLWIWDIEVKEAIDVLTASVKENDKKKGKKMIDDFMGKCMEHVKLK